MSEPITRMLMVKLTDKELQLKGQELAGLERQYEHDAETATEAAKAAKKALADLRARILELVLAIDTQQELRDVACQEVPNWEQDLVELVRSDTGEMVESRPLTMADRQPAITWEPLSAEE